MSICGKIVSHKVHAAFINFHFCSGTLTKWKRRPSENQRAWTSWRISSIVKQLQNGLDHQKTRLPTNHQKGINPLRRSGHDMYHYHWNFSQHLSRAGMITPNQGNLPVRLSRRPLMTTLKKMKQRTGMKATSLRSQVSSKIALTYCFFLLQNRILESASCFRIQLTTSRRSQNPLQPKTCVCSNVAPMSRWRSSRSMSQWLWQSSSNQATIPLRSTSRYLKSFSQLPRFTSAVNKLFQAGT